MQLVVGVPCLQETVAGVKLQLPPVKILWNTVHGAEMLCQALEELLAPSKKTTVLDIGCGIGLQGLYLSKKAGEVLGVDTNVAVDVATKNATLNGASDCRYFAGEAEVTIPMLVKKIKHDSVCAVVTCCFNNSYRSGRAMEELRKIRHLDRLVLVEDRTMSSSAILALNKPSSDKKMGNPFFPLKVVPVDSPNSRDYVLLVLLERVNSDDIQKFGIDSKSVAAESELRTKGSASRRPYERDSKVRLQQGDRRWLPNTLWDRGAFSQQRYDAGAGAMQNCLLQNTASYEHLHTADVLRACVGTANSLTDVELRRQMEEDYRRQMVEEEEQREWLAKEEQRRLREEMRLRQVQEEDWIRWVQDEQVRRIQEEEPRRIDEGEWRRRIQEERMREIQEEERMRRVQEEHMRQIQEEGLKRLREIQEEEEWMRRVHEERLRQIQEEEQMRQIQEERIRQIHEAEHMRQIQEREYRRIEEEEWRREMLGGQRRMKEEEWRRQIQEDERRKHIQKEEQRKINEEEWRRKMQRESQKRPLLVDKCSEKVVEEEKLRKPVKEESKRELVRGSVIRSRNDLVQDLITDTLRAAAIPQLSADAAEKVKHLVAEAIRTAGAIEQGERPGGGRNREVGGISREDTPISRFGTSDKEMSPSRHVEEEYLRFIREVESAYDHSHDMSSSTAGRYGSEQNDLKSQHQAVCTKSGEKLPSLLDLKLKHSEFRVESSYSAQHSDDRCGDTNQWQRKVLTVWKEFDSQAERDRPTNRSFNRGNQPRDLVRRAEKSTFSSVTENTADIYMRRSDLDQEKQRSSARRDRTDIRSTGNRNTIGRSEHSRKDHHHVVFGRPSTRSWLDSS